MYVIYHNKRYFPVIVCCTSAAFFFLHTSIFQTLSPLFRLFLRLSYLLILHFFLFFCFVSTSHSFVFLFSRFVLLPVPTSFIPVFIPSSLFLYLSSRLGFIPSFPLTRSHSLFFFSPSLLQTLLNTRHPNQGSILCVQPAVADTG